LLNGTVFTDTYRWIWAENFGAPIVINESLLQSYTGRLRLSPVVLKGGARFARLRAVGAFLVSGEIRSDGQISYLTITSEAGSPCSMFKPWTGTIRVREFPSWQSVQTTPDATGLSFSTKRGATYVLDRPEDSWEKQPRVRISAPAAKPRLPEWYRIQSPGGWQHIGSGRFVSVAEGAVMHSEGAVGATTGWQRPTVPVDTSVYPVLEVKMSGVGNGKLKIEAVGANGGEIIAGREWAPWPSTETALRLDLPLARTVVAITVLTTTSDGKPVENRIRSVRFLAKEGTPMEVDLKQITP
jgi:hypothetical protein